MRIGSRRSALALAQAKLVADRLGIAQPGGHEIVPFTTSGDRDATEGDKSRWVGELERALVAGEIDLAVHSAKDVPGELADGLTLLGTLPRAGAEDVLCGTGSLEELHAGARVGTSSLRRTAQLRAAREDLEIVTLSGNVDTRLRKLAEGELDAIVLARAGLQRLGREGEIGAVLDPERFFVPAPGQGALALEGRVADARAGEGVAEIADDDDFACLRAERALARELSATCNTPLGAYAVPTGCGCLHMRAWVGLPDGSAWIADELLVETGIRAEGACHPASVGFYDPEALGQRVAERMLTAGAGELLRRAEEMAGAGHA